MCNNSPTPQSHYFCGQKGIYYGKKKTSECHYIPLPAPYDHPQNTTAPFTQTATNTKPALPALVGSRHSSVLLKCKPSAAPAAAYPITLLEVVLGDNFQEKVEILLPLTHGISIPEQHRSVVHY